MKQAPPLLVVTDLDGTLLDHFTYSPAEALGTLRHLQHLGIPVIFNTSKTAEETRALGETLALSDPFIVENGSAIHYPKRSFPTMRAGTVSRGDCWVQTLGLTRNEVAVRLAPFESEFRFTRIASLPLDRFMAMTGLSMTAAQRAGRRQYSELLLWNDDPEALSTFSARLRAAGLNLLQGGRFLHVLGDTDKGHALDRVRTAYPRDTPVLALGDSGNDLAMLLKADYAAWVRSPVHGIPGTEAAGNIPVSEQVGPAGWAECVDKLLLQLHIPHHGQEEPRHG